MLIVKQYMPPTNSSFNNRKGRVQQKFYANNLVSYRTKLTQNTTRNETATFGAKTPVKWLTN